MSTQKAEAFAPTGDAGAAHNKRILVQVGALAAMTLIVLLPALLNGFPFVDIDSMSYLGAALALEIPENRPVYYSIFAALLDWAISPWPVAIAQCAIVAVGIWHAGGKLFRTSDLRVLTAIVVILTAASPLPWYAAQIMPDVFAAVLIVALLVIGFCWEQLNRWERGAYLLAVATSVSFHYANVPISLGANLVFGVLVLLGWKPNGGTWQRIFAMNGAILLGILALFGATTYDHGRPALSPSASTFYFARLLDDGSALEVLNQDCPQFRWKLCLELDDLNAYARRTANDPNAESMADYFLWRGPLQRLGDFEATEPDAAIIVRRAWAEHGLQQLSASLDNGLHQFGAVTVGQFFGSYGVGREPYKTIHRVFGDAVARDYLASRQQRGTINFGLVNIANVALLFGSLAFLAVKSRYLFERDREMAYLVLALLFFLCGNAFVMGAFSGVFERYQSRITWLVPLFALLLAARWFTTEWGRAPAVKAHPTP